MQVFLMTLLLDQHFSYYTLMVFLKVLSLILLSLLMILLSTLSVFGLLFEQLKLASGLEPDIRGTAD